MLVRKLIHTLKAEKSNLDSDAAQVHWQAVKLHWAIPPSLGPIYFYILFCRTHKFPIILQTFYVGKPLSFEVILCSQCKCQLPVVSIIMYIELSRSEGEMKQSAYFFLLRKGQPSLSKRAVKAKPSFKIHSVETVQESTCFKARQGRAEVAGFFCWCQKAPLVITSGARTQGRQRMDRARSSNCIQLHFVCFGDWIF